MIYIKLFESFLPKKESTMNVCWYNANIGDIVDESSIYSYVEYLHRLHDDFIEGDIGHRIEHYSKYKLTEVNIDDINIDEYDIDANYIKDYMKLYKSSNTYPPIILDGDRRWSYKNKYTIIDGTHRINALNDMGILTVLAWVGF